MIRKNMEIFLSYSGRDPFEADLLDSDLNSAAERHCRQPVNHSGGAACNNLREAYEAIATPKKFVARSRVPPSHTRRQPSGHFSPDASRTVMGSLL